MYKFKFSESIPIKYRRQDEFFTETRSMCHRKKSVYLLNTQILAMFGTQVSIYLSMKLILDL